MGFLQEIEEVSESSPTMVARGASINFLGDVLSAIEPVFYVLLSRLWGAETFGAYALAATAVSVALRVSVFGFDKGLLRHVPLAFPSPNPQFHLHQTIGTALRWTCVLSLLAILGQCAYALIYDGNHEAQGWMIAMAFSLPLETLMLVLLHAVRGRSQMFPFIAIVKVLHPLVLIVVTLGLYFSPLRTDAPVIAFLLAALVSAIAAALSFRKYFPKLSVRRLLRSPVDQQLVDFSRPQGFAEFFLFLFMRIDVLMVGYFFSDQSALIAIYSVVVISADIVRKPIHSFEISYAPVASAHLNQPGQHSALSSLYKEVTLWILLSYFFVAGILSTGAAWILSLFGNDGAYVEYWPIVPILCGAYFFSALSGPAKMTLLMSGHSRLELFNTVVMNLVNVALNLWLIPAHGLWGAAVASACSVALFNGVRMIQVRLILKLTPPQLWQVLRILLASVLAVVPAYLILRNDPFSPRCSSFAMIAFALSWVPAHVLTGAKSLLFNMFAALKSQKKAKHTSKPLPSKA